MISNYNTYDVAVMNYPLFNQKLNIDEYRMKMFQETETDHYKVPVYIHIPFCENICDFCIYNRIQANKNSELVEEYVKMLIKEIELYAEQSSVKKLEFGSVFFGGGTPTVLSESQLERVITKLKRCLNIEGCEMTVECNISNASESKLRLLRQLGVTRVSTGIQTFQDELRRKLHISGSSEELIEWVERAQGLGFQEVSGDLLYGFPDATLSMWKKDLEQSVKLSLNHISLYKLAVFANSILYHSISKYHYTVLKPDEIQEMFEVAHSFLLDCGYEQQSTQEYGRLGSKTEFWENTYDGYGANISMGTGSFGYLNGYCYQNAMSVKEYISILKEGKLPITRISEKSTPIQLMERTIVMGFRRGYVEKNAFYQEFHKEIKEVFPEVLTQLIKEGYVAEEASRYVLTTKGIYRQGDVSAEFMISIFEGTSALTKKYCVGIHEMPHHVKKRG